MSGLARSRDDRLRTGTSCVLSGYLDAILVLAYSASDNDASTLFTWLNAHLVSKLRIGRMDGSKTIEFAEYLLKYAPSITPVVLVIAAMIAFLAYYTSRGMRLDADQRAKDSLTFEMIKYWGENRDLLHRSSIRFAFYDALSDEQIQVIQNGSRLSLDVNYIGRLVAYLQYIGKMDDALLKNHEQNAVITIEQNQMDDIRLDYLRMMNSLEFVCIPYRLDLCNRDIFHEEMKTAFLQADSLKFYERMISIAGIWPSLKFTLEDMKKRISA